MIHFENATKQYPDGTVALSDVNIRISEGEFVSIIGRSGAGKSTFLRLINARILPTAGRVHVLGHHLSDLGDDRGGRNTLRNLRREIGFIFQQFNLIKSHTVLSNVLTGRLGYTSMFRGVFGLFSKQDEELALHVIEKVGLKDKAHKRVDQLSGGQQQRVAIARAIVQQPKIILADEPMASLDPKLSEVVLDLLYQFNQEMKITVLVNVHVLELAKRRANRIIGFKKGHLVFDGAPNDLTAEKVSLVYGE
ncbi:MAG: phosphonate ABC transporter ATP-binding protein [Bacteriovoracia bacterium]